MLNNIPVHNDTINKLEKIKSQYILKDILNYIHYKKLLEIIKYNKKSQNQLHINIDTYKSFSSIEIEIIPLENTYCKFIHFEKEEEKKYYHIYFNNSKEEIKRNYLNKNDNIINIKIKAIIDPEVKSFRKLFIYCKYIKSIHFKRFYRNDITDMSEMFSQCESLSDLDLSNFNTENVTDMNNMFFSCSS